MGIKIADGVSLVKGAKKYKDIFAPGSDVKEAKRTYLKLARVVHPDYLPDNMKSIGNTLFNKLTGMYNEFLSAVSQPDGIKTSGRSSKAIVFSTKKFSYVAEDKTGQLTYDGVLKSFFVEYKDKEALTRTGFLSLVVNASDNDLVQGGCKNLRQVVNHNEKLVAFYPELVDKGLFKVSGKDHFGFVNSQLPGDWFSLREVSNIFNNDLLGRDIAWIFKRLLVAVGNAYDAGIVHANVNEDSVLINPKAHGLVLRDWHYSVEAGSQLKAFNDKHKDIYSKGSLNKKVVDYNLDVKMAAETMLKISGPELPKKMKAFFTGCKYSTPHPAELLAEFNEVLYEVYGEPKFHEMKII